VLETTGSQAAPVMMMLRRHSFMSLVNNRRDIGVLAGFSVAFEMKSTKVAL
jgi:hypothetical protein